jgi:DnaJ-class molecular chaperone
MMSLSVVGLWLWAFSRNGDAFTAPIQVQVRPSGRWLSTPPLGASADPVEMARLRLEMHWGVEEAAKDCLVEDPSTCGSDECASCLGKGHKSCRFCRGTGQVYMGNHFMGCPICDHGLEECTSCRGTGWIAEWTQLLATENNKDQGSPLLP